MSELAGMLATSSSAMPPLHYTLKPSNPHAHEFTVTLTVADPDPAGQVFSLPVWIPGSYMVREFSRHIVSIRAEANGQPVVLTKQDKQRWQAAVVTAPLTLTYTVYAWDLSVRTAHLDATHGFFNGTSVFLCPEGKADRVCLLDLIAPEVAAIQGAQPWQVATSLPAAEGDPLAATRWNFGRYRAANYDELVDHPVEMGTFTRAEFVAGGVPHAVVLTGQQDADLARLTADLQRICQWQIDCFGGQANSAAPMSCYLFLVMVVGEGYGGLEHRASTALICSRNDLPHAATPVEPLPEGYLTFLGLCSHEYFHTWNVKRIKPAAFVPYDLSRENYTRLLWAFEGFTSYYDDLALLRCGLIAEPQYLALLAKTISAVHKLPGHQVQSVADSSFDAWIKYYRQDENTPNAVVSYYTKGALIALLLDLKLRQCNKALSLDVLMQQLWQRYGQTGLGLPEDGLYALVAALADQPLADWLQHTAETPGSLLPELTQTLAAFGVTLNWDASSKTPWLGMKLTDEAQGIRIQQVYRDSPAQQAGLAAEDVILACNGLRVNSKKLEQQLERLSSGATVQLHAFRRDELMQFTVTPQAAPADKATLQLGQVRQGTEDAVVTLPLCPHGMPWHRPGALPTPATAGATDTP